MTINGNPIYFSVRDISHSILTIKKVEEEKETREAEESDSEWNLSSYLISHQPPEPCGLHQV